MLADSRFRSRKSINKVNSLNHFIYFFVKLFEINIIYSKYKASLRVLLTKLTF